MKVLLIDVDAKMPNLALMKVSSFHKLAGDDVVLYRHRLPNGRFRKALLLEVAATSWDRVYVSCLFTWNARMALALSCMFGDAVVLRGGTGFDHGKPAETRAYLPPEIEAAPPDYELYPANAWRGEQLDYALGFCLRGCNRKCGFCDVPLKEGKIDIRQYRPPWTWVPDGFKKAALLDNDPALYPDALHDEIFKWFIDSGVRCSITQGYDIRCVTPARASLLANLRPMDTKFRDRTLYTAWDYWGIEGAIRERLPMLLDAGIQGRYITCYMICGFPQTPPATCKWDGADLTGPHAIDLHRFEVLWREFGVLPFVMIYNNERGDPWLRAFARWVDKRAFKACEWEDYRYNPDRQ